MTTKNEQTNKKGYEEMLFLSRCNRASNSQGGEGLRPLELFLGFLESEVNSVKEAAVTVQLQLCHPHQHSHLLRPFSVSLSRILIIEEFEADFDWTFCCKSKLWTFLASSLNRDDLNYPL